MNVLGRLLTPYGIALLVIVLVGAVLRVHQLGTQGLWYDEAFSVWVAKVEPSQFLQTMAGDAHPPLYYVMLRYWMVPFGDSEVALRAFSVLCGILAIPVIYRVGRKLFTREAGLVAALLLALSSFNVHYSQETRMYALLVLLVLISMYYFLSLFERGTLAVSVVYVLSTTLMLYTHLYGWFILVAQNVYVITCGAVVKDRGLATKRWMLLQMIVIGLFAPWIPVLVTQIDRVVGRQTGVAVFTVPRAADSIAQTFTVYAGTSLLLALFIVVAGLSFFTYKRTDRAISWRAPFKTLTAYLRGVGVVHVAAVWFLVLWVAAVTVVPFAISRVSLSIYIVRYAIVGSVALYLLVAGGITNLPNTYVKAAATGVIVVLLVAPLQTYYATPTTFAANPDGRGAFGFIDTSAKRGDTVIIYPTYNIVIADYYSNRTDIKSFGAPQKSNDENVKELNASVGGSERVWFVYSAFANPHLKNLFLNTFNESYNNVSLTRFHRYDVYLFEKR